MSLFGELAGLAGQALQGGEGQQAVDNALSNSNLGGVGGLLGQLNQAGLGDVVGSLCNGDTQAVGPEVLKAALSNDHVQQIASNLGVSPDDALQLISQHLPALAAQQGAAAASQGGQSDQGDQSDQDDQNS